MKRIVPLILTFNVVLLDQLSKYLIIERIPQRGIGASFFGDFLRIVHVRNPGIAFSIGRGLPEPTRSILFTFLPLVVLVILGLHFFKSDEYTPFQRWMAAGVLGGGTGNLLDRVFRPDGVVDFIDVKIYGFLGMERWPTFNIADSAVVVCGIAIALSLFVTRRERG